MKKIFNMNFLQKNHSSGIYIMFEPDFGLTDTVELCSTRLVPSCIAVGVVQFIWPAICSSVAE